MNTKKRLSLFFIATGLVGCATCGQLEAGLNALVGRPEQDAFSALGYPSGQQQFAGDKVYVWGQSRNATMFMPQTSTTTGYVGTTPVYGSTTSMQAIPMNFNCTIKVIVDGGGTIKTWEYDGNMGGCKPYIDRLNSYFKR